MAIILNKGSLVGRIQVPDFVIAEIPPHGELEGRDEADQHPIEAITGLREELDNVKELIKQAEEEGINKDDVATDEEADEVIEDVFDDVPSGDVDEEDVATDEEVEDVIDDVFGEDDTQEVATDEEVNNVISDVFGDL